MLWNKFLSSFLLLILFASLLQVCSNYATLSLPLFSLLGLFKTSLMQMFNSKNLILIQQCIFYQHNSLIACILCMYLKWGVVSWYSRNICISLLIFQLSYQLGNIFFVLIVNPKKSCSNIHNCIRQCSKSQTCYNTRWMKLECIIN